MRYPWCGKLTHMSRIIGIDAALVASAVVAVAMSGLALSGFSPRSTAAASTTAESPSVSPPASVATPSATPTPAATPLAKLPADKVANLVVIGDGSSNETGEWVNQLGEQFGKTRSTQVRRVNQAEGTSYNDPMHYGEADPRLDIWNASATPPVTVDATTAPELIASAPSLVLISQGREASTDVPAQLSKTLKAIRSDYPKAPVAVILQPAILDGSKSDSLAAVKTWATDQGLPTIDVDKAFTAAGSSSGNAGEFQVNGGELTEAGHTLWAKTVFAAISGS